MPLLLKESLRTGVLSHASRSYVPLPKSANPKRVGSNVNVFDFELNPQDMKTLDDLDRGKDGAVAWNPVDAP